MSNASAPIRLMVASTVYNYEDQINQICGVLASNAGYEIWNSHYGTIPTHPGKSNLENCLQAVEDCDAFIGIIRPFYGSGVVGSRSITHEEMRLAVELKKPRWFVVHHHVTFARQLFRQFDRVENKLYRKSWTTRRSPVVFEKTSVMDDLRVIDIFDDVAQSGVPAEDRIGHWVQEFKDITDVMRKLETEFRDPARIQSIIDEMNNAP